MLTFWFQVNRVGVSVCFSCFVSSYFFCSVKPFHFHLLHVRLCVRWLTPTDLFNMQCGYCCRCEWIEDLKCVICNGPTCLPTCLPFSDRLIPFYSYFCFFSLSSRRSLRSAIHLHVPWRRSIYFAYRFICVVISIRIRAECAKRFKSEKRRLSLKHESLVDNDSN